MRKRNQCKNETLVNILILIHKNVFYVGVFNIFKFFNCCLIFIFLQLSFSEEECTPSFEKKICIVSNSLIKLFLEGTFRFGGFIITFEVDVALHFRKLILARSLTERD